MGMAYTAEQQRVIGLHGKNILVSAAAGSGKTAVLTERIVKMVSDGENPVDIDRLLVVTFTNAAAAEMRERIGAAIAARLEAEPGNEHLQKQATLIHNAQITTIDSFCMYVIRNNFNDIGLDPGFRVADEGELRLLRQDVMQELLEERFAEKEERFLHCVEYFSTGNQDKAIEGHILKLYQFAESNPWPEEWLEERKRDYDIGSMEEMEQAEFIKFGMRQVRLMAEDCLRKIRECTAICEQPDGPYMYGATLEKEAGQLEQLASVSRYEEGYALFGGMVFGRLPSKKDDSVSAAKRGMVQEIRKDIKETLKKICTKYFPVPPETVLAYMQGSREAVCELVDLTVAFKEALDRKKREENIIDFSDMEHLALSILVQRADKEGEGIEKGREGLESGKAEIDKQRKVLGGQAGEGMGRPVSGMPADGPGGQVGKGERPAAGISADGSGGQKGTGSLLKYKPTQTALDYREFFEEILIDEYQDSNPVQEMLLESISGESAGRFNRFMVGDVKQSIYKFRLARPEIFMEKYEEYGAAEKSPSYWKEGCPQPEQKYNGRKKVQDGAAYKGESSGPNPGQWGQGSGNGSLAESRTGGKKERIDLHKNFRSRKEVLDSVNYLFAQIMGKKLGGVEYNEEAALYCGASYPEWAEGDKAAYVSALQGTAGGGIPCSPNCTELLLICKEENEGKEETESYGEREGKADKAQKIEKLQETGEIGKTEKEETGSTEEQPAGSVQAALSSRQREALAVAKRIKELVAYFKVTDKESGELRPVRYKDIVILLRTNAGWDEDFRSMLKEEGIPAHVSSKTGYFAAKEIQTLLQLLRILDNPRQDIPLFGVMVSCFGGFTEEEVAWVRAYVKEKKCLYFALKEFMRGQAEMEGTEERIRTGERAADGGITGEKAEYSGAADVRAKDKEAMNTGAAGGIAEDGGKDSWQVPEGLTRKVGRFLDFLEEYRDKTVYMPIHELLQDIITETDYLPYVAALPGGGQRRANVQMLLEKASAFEQTSYYGLFHFVRYIEQLEKYDVDYGEANVLDENADVVRIMSIHKSKGLEFPVCFVCGLAKKFNMQDLNGRMIADVDMGIGVDYVDVEHRQQSKTVRKNIVAEKMRLDNLGEELRVLYVALTRAKEKLILTGAVERPEKKMASLLPAAARGGQQLPYGELAGAGSYLDFLLPALCRHPAFAPMWELYGLDVPEVKQQLAWEAPFAIRMVGEEELLAADIAEQAAAEGARLRLEHSDVLTDMDNELMTHMSEIFSYQYKHSNLADLYTKTTVSELKKAGQAEEQDFSFQLYEEETVIPYIPKFMQEQESIGGAGRGSAFHKVMELLDFASAGEAGSAAEQMEHMVQEGMLGEEYARAVSVHAIEVFLRTSLARRMKRAEEKGCLYREQPFVLGLPARELNEKFPEEELVLIQGIIDVYFEEDGEIVVADYKTDRVENGQELVKKYKTQLDYYAHALEEMTGKKVKEKIIYSFGLREEIWL